jgi:hypothetical protein
MNQSRFLGDGHVSNVYRALDQKSKTGRWSNDIPLGVLETAKYLWNKFPNPSRIVCKFEHDNPDKHHDLTITWNNQTHFINLFQIQGNAQIQPKNLGAKSFLKKYFLAPELQCEFNSFFEEHYNDYLFNMVSAKGLLPETMETSKLKKLVSDLYPHFDDKGNLCRDEFLFALREHCYLLLLQTYNEYKEGFEHAFRTLLLVGETNIITRFYRNKVSVEEFRAEIAPYEEIKIYKKGRYSIGIQFGAISLLLRFKFENKPDSSIKLATSYEFFNDSHDFAAKIHNQNIKTLQNMDNIYENTHHVAKENTSNAVGKCHEAFAYYWMLKRYPDAIQTDDREPERYLRDYLPYLSKETALQIKESSAVTAEVIASYIWEKYRTTKIVSLQLVGDIYLSDRLNTGDLKISIRGDGDKITEVYLSLKALRSANQKITTKNPGIGTILGPTYFDLVDDFSETINSVKREFENHQNHQTSLIRLSNEIGAILEGAPQENLRKGIENLLGKALMVITIYEQKRAYCLEHQNINTPIIVLRNTPSNIQNTFVWNYGSESLSLRVKFSRGQRYGWSPVKLVSEYGFTPKNR